MASAVPLARLVRSGLEESVHLGHVAVCDADGRLVAWTGDPDRAVFARSSMKPLQAVVSLGAIGRDLPDRQVAVMCGSHEGEPIHVRTVRALLRRGGLTEEALRCPPAYPFDARSHARAARPRRIAHNCSGKHAGMLACCVLHGWRKDDYLDPGHPLQREIRSAVATFSGVADDELASGIDGCSAPNYALPLAALARAYARLAAADAADPDFGAAPAMLRDAMVACPEMVSGAGRSDAALMVAGAGDWVAKIGAEGVQAIGIASLGIGIAVKVADGAKRALLPVVVAVLDQLGLLDAARRAALAALARPNVTNYRGLVTGTIESVVELGPG